ncbi:MAG: 4a-hydroxytetrahydrobiopterin dehydratase [Chloroflexota bacterium]|nr:4a-hydroxytetrahydrobiopterin dehydratase [Chloroflexota bacterium]
MPRLSDTEITEALRDLPAWERQDDEIVRTVRFPAFMDGIRFINRVAELAEAADHHPDVDIRYRNVRFALSTHDQGGLTEKDVALAKQIDEALG